MTTLAAAATITMLRGRGEAVGWRATSGCQVLGWRRLVLVLPATDDSGSVRFVAHHLMLCCALFDGRGKMIFNWYDVVKVTIDDEKQEICVGTILSGWRLRVVYQTPKDGSPRNGRILLSLEPAYTVTVIPIPNIAEWINEQWEVLLAGQWFLFLATKEDHHGHQVQVLLRNSAFCTCTWAWASFTPLPTAGTHSYCFSKKISA